MRGVSQIEPKATVVVIFSRPCGRSLLSASSASVIASLREDLVRGAVQQLALLGQDQAARVAMEQRHAQAVLERADLPADRRLARFSGSPACVKLPASATAWKIPQLVPVHRHLPSQPCRTVRGVMPRRDSVIASGAG